MFFGFCAFLFFLSFNFILFPCGGYATVYSLELESVSCDVIGCWSSPEAKNCGISGWDVCSNVRMRSVLHAQCEELHLPRTKHDWACLPSWHLLVLLQTRTSYSCVITGAISRSCEDAVERCASTIYVSVKAPSMKWSIMWKKFSVLFFCYPIVLGDISKCHNLCYVLFQVLTDQRKHNAIIMKSLVCTSSFKHFFVLSVKWLVVCFWLLTPPMPDLINESKLWLQWLVLYWFLFIL